MSVVGRTDRAKRRFYAVAAEKKNKPGTWSYSVMTIYDNGVEIGQYERNYPSYGAQTFEPFELSGKWFALYSPNYTATRVMSLPDCRDLGGEERHSAGFCPVDLFVPRYRVVMTRSLADGVANENWAFEKAAESATDHEFDAGKTRHEVRVGAWRNLTIGFVAGCVWGQDTSWKLQTIDVSRAAEGIIVRSERFGFVELAGKLSLSEAVIPSKWRDLPLMVRILREETRNLETGELIDPADL